MEVTKIIPIILEKELLFNLLIFTQKLIKLEKLNMKNRLLSKLKKELINF